MKRLFTLLALLVFAVLLSSAPVIAIDAYSVKRTDITTTSVNIDWSFTPLAVMVTNDDGNTAEICINWTGGTASCPASDTAGSDRLPVGATVIAPDHYSPGSISIIAASGTQTVYVRAWGQ